MTSKIRHQGILAVHLFLMDENKVLLLRRFHTGYEDGKYSVPAGHVEKGEGALEAMVRETKEEIGIKLQKKSLQLVHCMHRQRLDEGNERVDFFFTVPEWNGEPKICEPDKCDQLRWVGVTKLPQNMVPYVKKALKLSQKKQLYSEYGWNKEEQ